MSRQLLLDLFCGAGGAASGYHDAGFEVIGVDINPQPRYPFKFVQADAMKVLEELASKSWPLPTLMADAVHASPPCQDHSSTKDLGGRHGTGWMLGATLELLKDVPVPWVVENVRGAPVAHQDDLFGASGLELCGCMFPELRGLLYEARWFQTSFGVPQPPHRLHQWRQTKMGRPPVPGECMQVTGHFSDVPEGRRRMGVDWMTQSELAQAIPPAYTRLLGEQLIQHLHEAAA